MFEEDKHPTEAVEYKLKREYMDALGVEQLTGDNLDTYRSLMVAYEQKYKRQVHYGDVDDLCNYEPARFVMPQRKY